MAYGLLAGWTPTHVGKITPEIPPNGVRTIKCAFEKVGPHTLEMAPGIVIGGGGGRLNTTGIRGGGGGSGDRKKKLWKNSAHD